MHTPRILFVRVGYMKYYAGPQTGDKKPKHGGSYNINRVGHEVYNFKPVAAKLYGYVQPYLNKETDKPTTLNLERIDRTAKLKDLIEDVLVIFVARSDKEGQVIVGWYDKAKVYRAYQGIAREVQGQKSWYLLRGKLTNAMLLPEKYRTNFIPTGKGAFGRANIVYPYENDGTPRNFHSGKYRWIGEAISFIDAYDGPNLLSNSYNDLEDQIEAMVENEKIQRSGQGFRISQEQRKKIENFAVNRATKHFKSIQYKVKYVGRTRPYDLECRKKMEVLRVEVKGTQTDGASIMLTRNEVLNAKKHLTALFILHSIKLWPGSSAIPSGGKSFILNPWQINAHGKLEPLAYRYDIRPRFKKPI